MLEQYVTSREAADLLHVHVNTLKRWGDRGVLPFVRLNARGDRRWSVSGIEAFLNAREGGNR